LSASLQRVGMFGGAFDPPHRAHVALAEAAVSQLGLDRLYIFPTGDAWHKERTLTPAGHRLAMARLAFDTVPGAVVDDREMRRQGATYSIDTLRELQAEHPGSALFLLMGEDQAAGFTGWRAWKDIAQLATLAVAQRGPGAGVASLQALPDVRVQPMALPQMPESATDIRARLTAGQDITQLVDPRVASYIARHKLYAPT
jgi:nicotinate-nucleotide adenylyltransferase